MKGRRWWGKCGMCTSTVVLWNCQASGGMHSGQRTRIWAVRLPPCTMLLSGRLPRCPLAPPTSLIRPRGIIMSRIVCNNGDIHRVWLGQFLFIHYSKLVLSWYGYRESKEEGRLRMKMGKKTRKQKWVHHQILQPQLCEFCNFLII